MQVVEVVNSKAGAMLYPFQGDPRPSPPAYTGKGFILVTTLFDPEAPLSNAAMGKGLWLPTPEGTSPFIVL